MMSLASSLGVQFHETVSAAALRVLWLTGLIALSFCIYLLVSVLKNIENVARQALYEANGRLELQATTDGLTGIYNRRAFDRVLEQEWKRHERAALPLSVLLIDADYFKQYNDAYGHLAGDDCLRAIARSIQCTAHRTGDFVARYGGEEFAVILPLTDAQGAGRIAEDIRRHVQSLAMPHCDSSVGPHVTVSIGTTSAVPTLCRTHQEFLQDADVALYRAKAAGRNETVHMGPVTAGV
jgi:diguanylate cyclase (GGDEF)-like protein